ncbi:lytic polysaccharide monooxygenase [Streptomyces sp. NPDC020742]|uniref:lytic polysaccharide monooxygenase n=1 Tax=Streptomyces sp. NPDC020742 TaxID=3154897 RepID=UPI00340D4114
MTVRRKATSIALVGLAPLALTALSASPAAAHGSMSDPVSRILACYTEGPESPKSAACKAAVAAGGAQAFYDWNGVRDGNAGGQSRTKIPDGKLCSANNPEFKGLDLARADWPASAMKAGAHTFRYKGTAPHRGSFELYITKPGYNPSKPLKWSDLESKPFVKVNDPKLVNGEYIFSGKVPARSGRHLIYSVWQRSDSPEAFYTCSDVVFGKGAAATGQQAPAAKAPTQAQLSANADKSTVGMGHDHGGGMGDMGSHGGAGGQGGTGGHGDSARTLSSKADEPALGGGSAHGSTVPDNAPDSAPGNAPHTDGSAAPVDGKHLAETGGSSSTTPLAISGAAVLALGAGVMFAATRRKTARHRG